MTIYLDDQIERLVKDHVKASGESTSKWVAEAIKRRAKSEWPPGVLALFGTWKDEVPDPKELRDFGPDLRREQL